MMLSLSLLLRGCLFFIDAPFVVIEMNAQGMGEKKPPTWDGSLGRPTGLGGRLGATCFATI